MRIMWAILVSAVLSLALSVPSQLSAQQIPGDVPVWKIGDLWTWRWEDNSSGGRSGAYTRTVTKVDEVFEGQKVYWTSTGDGTFALVSAADLWTLARVDAAGNVRTRYTIKTNQVFPLAVGKTYSFDYDNPSGQYRGTYTHSVVGVEEVRVPAGTFPAFRVAERGQGTTYRGAPWTIQGELYFAPAAKVWVKYTYSLNTGYKYSRELIRYQVRQE